MALGSGPHRRDGAPPADLGQTDAVNSPWKPSAISDLSGKVVVVTGANTGLGFETTRVLAEHGAHVVIASRNADKAAAAQRSIEKRDSEASVEVITVDLADLATVERFAESFSDRHDQLDVLINNAGIMMVPKGQTADGFERQLGTNHLGHFALTGRLIGVLGATPDARVVTVSSIAHRSGSMDFDNLMYEHGYRRQAAYGRSKLANLLFAFELQRRCEAAELDITSVAAHPGVSSTDLGNHLMDNLLLRPLKLLSSLALQDAAAGAEPTLRAATDPTATGGDYFGPAGMGEVRGRATRVTASSTARDPDIAAELWATSEQLTGVTFP